MKQPALSRILTFPIIIALSIGSMTLTLSGCENPELTACKEKASPLWDNRKNPSHKNKPYWDAIERCKQKHS